MCKLGCDTQIQQSADILVKWSTDNDMKINESKTKEMVICFSRTKNNADTVPHICINDTLIERVQEYKVLGLTISSVLTWTVHVDNITAGKRVYMLYQHKRAPGSFLHRNIYRGVPLRV